MKEKYFKLKNIYHIYWQKDENTSIQKGKCEANISWEKLQSVVWPFFVYSVVE